MLIPRRRMIFLLLTIFLCLGLSSAFGDGRAPLLIFADIQGDAEGEKRGFSDLFFKSLELESRLQGFSLSDKRNSQILLEVRYQVDGDHLDFTLQAKARKKKEDLFSVVGREEISFSLDGVLLGYAQRAMEALAEYRDVSGEVFQVQAPLIKPKKGLVGSADFGCFFASGERARYLKTGYAASGFVGTAVSSRVDLGLGLGAVLFSARGYAAEAQGIILPLGLGLRFWSESSDILSAGIRLDIGAALFSVWPEVGAPQSKIIPSADVGLSMAIGRGSRALLGSSSLTLFYEGRSILYGFTPRIGLRF